MGFRYGAATDRGRVREGNEDNYVSGERLFAVADGMGGYEGGEIASQIAVDELAQVEQQGPWAEPAAALEALRQAFKAANAHIRDHASHNHALKRMGTTLTAVLDSGQGMYLAHIGDSRAYLYRNGQLTQLTDDHSVVQQLVEEGRLTPEEAEHHPHRNIITRALGVDDHVEPDTRPYQPRPGDRMLLCTDGLSGMVDDGALQRVLGRVRDPQEVADELVALANAEGGVDNITVVVIDMDGAPDSVGGDTGRLSATPPPPGRTVQVEDRAMATAPQVVTPEVQEPPSPDTRARARRTRRQEYRGERRTWRRLFTVGLVLGVIALGLVGAWRFVDSRYWVGIDENTGLVTVFRGLPVEVGGVRLASVEEQTRIPRDQIPEPWVGRLEEGVAQENLEDARRYAQCTPLLGGAGLGECLQGRTGQAASTTTVAPTSAVTGVDGSAPQARPAGLTRA